MKTRDRVVILAGAGVIAAALAGCSGSGPKTDEAVSSRPTPELTTLSQRPCDVDNAYDVTINSNWRAMKSDLMRAFLLDRPSRLALEPITH